MKRSNGFTLIELIVVIAVLLFVVGTATGIFIFIVQQQRRILAEQELLNQTSFVLEHMSKALRMAKKDSTGTACLGGVSYAGRNYMLTQPDSDTGFYRGIKFINQSDNDICQEFYLDNSDPQNPVLKEKKNGLPLEGVAITSDKFMINSVGFSINGRNGSISEGDTDDDDIQPRVTIFLEVQVKDLSQSAKKIQTTISQRDLNVQP